MVEARTAVGVRRRWLGALSLALLAGTTGLAQAQGQTPVQPPPSPPAAPEADGDASAVTILGLLSPAARAAILQPFNSPEEARALRLKHGVPTGKDLSLPAARARIALLRGVYTDPSLSDTSASPLDRAEALVRLGEPAKALELIGTDTSVRAAAVGVSAMELLGRREDAVAMSTGLARRLTDGELTTCADIVDAVRAGATLIRLTGPRGQNGADFEYLMGALRQARELDPLDYRVPLTEAELLLDKDNFAQARAAINACVLLSPTAADAWLLAGSMAVLAFDFEASEQAAARLDSVAGFEPADEMLPPDVGPRSALAAVVRARALLRQDAPATARTLIQPHALAMPGSPLLLETLASITAAEYDFAKLDTELDAFEQRFPGSAQAAMRAGQTLADLRQYAQAERVLERARALAPFWAAPVTELGLMQVQSGRDEQALAALTRAFELDPFNVRAGNSLKLLKDLMTYQRVEGEHFVVRAKKGLDARLAAEMLPILAKINTDVTGDAPGALRYQPPFKTLIDISPDHAGFAVRIAGVPRIHTIAASTGPVIAMESPRDGRGHSGAYDWARVLRHEYVHTVGLSKTGNRLPHWFTEAQAVYLERAPRDYNTVKLLTQTLDSDDLFDFNQINIAFTRPKRPQDRALAYAQGHWMYQFMVERFGPEAPLKLMDEFSRGVREEEAFTKVLGVGRDGFMDAFKPWAREQLTSWGMLVPTADAMEAAIRQRLEASSGRVDDALATDLEAYAVARPVDPFPHRLLARHYLDRNPVKAVEHLRWLDEREDKEATFAAQIAAILAQQGDFNGAWPSAERAVRVAPYSAANRELAALIAVQRKDWPSARGHLEFLAELEPDRDQHRKRLDALSRMEKGSPAP